MTRVHVVGTGLVGTSLGLALSRLGDDVTLEDISPTHAALARDLGAGRLAEGPVDPELVVVATPPDVTADCVADALRRWPRAAVTDVASVKGAVLEALRASGADLTRYCGSHPMAGRERSGAVSGRHDLFDGRAWVITPTAETDPAVVALVTAVARSAGAAVSTLDPARHDAAVAAVSHVPQLAASLVAAVDCEGFRGTLWSEEIEAVPGAARPVLYKGGELDGLPAVLHQGRAWYLSTLPEPDALRDLLARIAGEAGVRPVLDGLPGGVEAVRRGDLLFLLNHGREPVTVTVPGTHRDLLTGTEVTDRAVLGRYDVKVLKP